MPFSGPLEDRLLIRERYDAYSDAVFRADTDAYLACWADDGVRSGAGGECRGRDELRSHWDGIWEVVDRMTFFTQLAALDVDGDSATARAFCLELLSLRSGDTRHVVGRYDDVLHRVDGVWLFSERRYEIAMDRPSG